MELYPPFPTCREDTPNRQAEKQIYEAFQACDFDGRVLYEVRPLPTAPQLDFAVWIVGVGIFGIQVKGGKYRIIDGQWFLITDRGRSLRESPVPGTWDAAMAIRDVVQEHVPPEHLRNPGPGHAQHGAQSRTSRPSPGPGTSRCTGETLPRWSTTSSSWPSTGRSTSRPRRPASPPRCSWSSPGWCYRARLRADWKPRRSSTSTSSTCTSTSPRACRNCRGRRTSTQQPPVDLVEDGGQEDRGRRDIQGRQVERRFIRPVRGRQNWLTQALRWAAAPSWRRMAETNHDGCEQECGCWEEGFADALAGMQEWSITVHDGICRCEFCVTGIALIEAALGDMAGILREIRGWSWPSGREGTSGQASGVAGATPRAPDALPDPGSGRSWTAAHGAASPGPSGPNPDAVIQPYRPKTV